MLPEQSPPRAIGSVWFHALLWVGFAVAAVVLRGPVWEENYEFAQVFLDDIAYPEAHPLYLHTKNLFTLQLYLTAAQVWLGGDPAWVCGVRNVLYLIAKTLPFFLLGAWAGKRVLVGHVAALAAFLAAGEGFTRAYPTLAWSMFAGNGVVGSGAALAALVCLVCGRYGIGFALAAALPAIHLGQCPPLGLFCAILFFHVLLRGTGAERLRMFAGIAVGGSVTVLSLVVWWWSRVDYAPAPPYTSELSPEIIWQRWLSNLGGHQVFGVGIDQLAMVWSLWLLLACLLAAPRGSLARTTYGWLLLYCSLLCGIVWVCMALHAYLGERTPHLLLGWMPYRLPNHLPPLMVTLVVLRVFAVAQARLARAGLLLILVLPFIGVQAQTTLIVLTAFALPSLAQGVPQRLFAPAWTLLSIGLWYGFLRVLGLEVTVFAGALLAGTLAMLADQGAWPRLPERVSSRYLYASAVAAMLVCLPLLRPLVPAGEPDLVADQAFERAVAALQGPDAPQPNEMLCVPHHQRTLQGRLDQPVLSDFAMLTWVPYHPELGPAIHALYRDMYGLDIAPAPAAPHEQNWAELWTSWPVERWRAMASRYGFRHVVAPTFLELPLTPLTEGGLFRLYLIPAA